MPVNTSKVKLVIPMGPYSIQPSPMWLEVALGTTSAKTTVAGLIADREILLATLDPSLRGIMPVADLNAVEVSLGIANVIYWLDLAEQLQLKKQRALEFLQTHPNTHNIVRTRQSMLLSWAHLAYQTHGQLVNVGYRPLSYIRAQDHQSGLDYKHPLAADQKQWREEEAIQYFEALGIYQQSVEIVIRTLRVVIS